MGRSALVRRLAATAAVVGVAVVVSACGDDDGTASGAFADKVRTEKAFGGTAEGSEVAGLQDLDDIDLPTNSDEPDIPESEKIDASAVDPCTILTPSDLALLGLPEAPAEEQSDDDGAHCGWAGDDARVLVALGAGDFAEVEDGLGLGPAVPATFEGYDAARIESPDACGLLFHATGDNTFAVIASNPDGRCGLVDEVASLVLAHVG